MVLIDAEAYSEAVGLVYDCALDPGLWPAALERLRHHMAFRSGSIDVLALPAGRLLVNATSGMDDAWLARWQELADEGIEQWGGAERVAAYPIGEPQIRSVVNPQALTDRYRYYSEIIAPRGLIDSLAMPLTYSDETIASISFGRHRDEGPIGPREMGLARLFAPHLRRSVSISRLLDAQAVRAGTLAGVLDGIATRIILVDAEMRLVHANRAGKALLSAGEPFRLEHGRLVVTGSANQALALALRPPLQGLNWQGGGLPVIGRQREPLVVYAVPLRQSRNVMAGAVGALFVAASTEPRPAPIAAIAALFDLTPTEAAVLEQIERGGSTAQVAEVLGISVSTVRTHLLHLFDKTGTHRRSTLQSLVNSLKVPIE